ncbi:MAG: hypothetical protein OXT74_18315, partial [Candidatus Poribacteria bacterium]|nr:hypothetical protein [Candidatus Poribacteria bacterium]
ALTYALSCHIVQVAIFAVKDTETEFFPTWKHEIDEKSHKFTYNSANVNQKLGFSVIGSNLRYIMEFSLGKG